MQFLLSKTHLSTSEGVETQKWDLAPQESSCMGKGDSSGTRDPPKAWGFAGLGAFALLGVITPLPELVE